MSGADDDLGRAFTLTSTLKPLLPRLHQGDNVEQSSQKSPSKKVKVLRGRAGRLAGLLAMPLEVFYEVSGTPSHLFNRRSQVMCRSLRGWLLSISSTSRESPSTSAECFCRKIIAAFGKRH